MKCCLSKRLVIEVLNALIGIYSQVYSGKSVFWEACCGGAIPDLLNWRMAFPSSKYDNLKILRCLLEQSQYIVSGSWVDWVVFRLVYCKY
jgi:hypothetical protein